MNHPLKFVATTGIVLFFLMLKTGSLAAAREEHPRQPDAQQQEEEKDIPVITNPAVFNEKDLDKLLEKQREYIKNIIRITKLFERARNRIILTAVIIRDSS